MITKQLFDKYESKDIYSYTLTDTISVTICTLGATVLSLYAPDKNGAQVDVALGMTDVDGLLHKVKYMGATVGRCANRIANGKFALNEVTYQLTQNDGENHLHGGARGFNGKVFDVVEVDNQTNSILLHAESLDCEDGYPAKLDLFVKYTVTDSELVIDYFAESNGDTLCNPTNHTYFNLNGENDGSILDNYVQIYADSFLQVGEDLIPTNKVSIHGTPFDFRTPKQIGRDIDSNDVQLKNAGGYDHNFCIQGEHAVTAYSTKTGIAVDVYTDMEGMQFYTGNFLTGEKGKSVYNKRSGFCMETQFYPNAINRTDCKQPVLKKDEKFHSRTKYVFSVKH